MEKDAARRPRSARARTCRQRRAHGRPRPSSPPQAPLRPRAASSTTTARRQQRSSKFSAKIQARPPRGGPPPPSHIFSPAPPTVLVAGAAPLSAHARAARARTVNVDGLLSVLVEQLVHPLVPRDAAVAVRVHPSKRLVRCVLAVQLLVTQCIQLAEQYPRDKTTVLYCSSYKASVLYSAQYLQPLRSNGSSRRKRTQVS
jgi:hypothetical protein